MNDHQRRRSIDRTMDFWFAVRGARNLPRCSDMRPWCQPQIEPDAFLVEFDPRTGEMIFPHGASPVHAVGGVRVEGTELLAEGATEIWSRIAALIDRAKSGQPATDDGRAMGAHGRIIRYRTVVLPLGDDGKNVTAAAGAFSFKSVH